jgi:hypothetical protein
MKRVLLIGFDPAVVDFSKWPGMTADKVRTGIEADQARLIEFGYEVKICFVDLGATAENEVAQALSAESFNCVLIGAGIRKDDDYFLLFEKLINLIHQHAPSSRICFNTNPTDTAAAVLRWV